MAFKSKINLMKSLVLTNTGFLILTNLFGCGSDKNNHQSVNDPMRPETQKKFVHLQPCPASVTAKGKDGGYIELNWSAYAPNTNTYFTFMVIPHALGGITKNVSETTDKGVSTLDGYYAGSYYVSYTIYPASSDYPPCMGIEPKLIFL